MLVIRHPLPAWPACVVGLGILIACGGGARPAKEGAPPPAPQVAPATAAGALNRFAAEKVMVIPAQEVVALDPLAWKAKAGADKALLLRVDSTLEAGLRDRGLSAWVYAPALVRAVKRNPTYLTDPYQVRAAGPVRVALRAREPWVLEPLSSQLRGLAGVTDAAWALVPVDVAFVRDASGGGRAVLSLAIIDVRGAQVRWAGSVTGDAVPDYEFSTIASAIQKAADLFVPR